METTLAAPQPISFRDRPHDTKFSLYWWDIVLNMQWAGEYGEGNNVKDFRGYSQRQGQTPPASASAHLQGVIERVGFRYLRPAANGSGSRATRMTIHRRASKIIDLDYDPVVVTLEPDAYVPGRDLMSDFETLHYINRLYAAMREGKDIKRLRPERKQITRSNDDFLNVDLQFQRIGRNENLLLEYLEKLSRYRHPVGAICNFYHQYCVKYLKPL